MSKDKCSFDPHVTEVLSVLGLVHLSLTHFCKVRLSVIANLCPHLKFLAVRVCDIDEDDDTGATTFSNLEHLYIGSAMKEPSFFKLLSSCPGLRELELDKDELTTAFIAGPSSLCSGEPFRLEHLERLTLRTFTEWYKECSLNSRTELVSELDATIRRLPSLRRVRTDNYKIRLRIGSCFPNIALDWCTCTACFAEFPRIHSLQEETYAATQYLKLPEPIELVEVSVGRKSEESIETEEFKTDRNPGANAESEKESMVKGWEAVLTALTSRAEDDAVSEGGESARTTITALESLMSEKNCTTRGARARRLQRMLPYAYANKGLKRNGFTAAHGLGCRFFDTREVIWTYFSTENSNIECKADKVLNMSRTAVEFQAAFWLNVLKYKL
ncbi:hypothetical protein HPB50_017412 [Hyalomma asiaticum]|uniref:Uncharacterized protein n=1 Tax=Hyalomma asiaticum TaxID=266040 RepID=A0ACB7RWX3_HYAAI|nr:hypothetical protein HPB50_017412 [Hyalomma asiaticum]